MTRLTEGDVRGLTERLATFERDLVGAGGMTLRALAQRTVDLDRVLAATPDRVPDWTAVGHLAPAPPVPMDGARVAAVPVSTGEGVIPGFCECVVAILRHLGCDARVTALPDVRGLQEAVEGGDAVIFVADDFRFVALNVREGRCVDDDPATADGYATALAAVAGGLAGRPVLLLGLGPVGRAAGRRLAALGAELLAVEPDPGAAARAVGDGLAFEPVGLHEGLARCDLVFDATPVADLIDARDLRAGAVAAVPGVPSGFTAAAREVLGVRHIHEPLAVGVAVMAARAFA